MADLSEKTLRAFVIFKVWSDGLEIDHLETHSSFRRQGLMKELLLQLFLEHEDRFIWLDVSIHNKAAQALYRRLKFEKTGIRKNYYAPGDHALLLTRQPERGKRLELAQ